MAHSYEQIIAPHRARMSPEELQQQAVFEEAYNIAMQVIELREQHGLTQAELAARCGMNQADISRIERGSTSPTVRTLQRIANALSADLRLVKRAA